MAVTKAKEQGKKLLSVHLLVIHQLQQLHMLRRAGLKAIVVIPEVRLHSVNYRKLLCMVLKLFLLKETLMRLLEIVKEIAENDEEIELVNSVNPYRIEGQNGCI